MQSYRSKQTIQAVQYKGDPIPDVTCAGGADERIKNNCAPMFAHLPHVHTKATGGLTCLKPGDWIVPERGGPFAVASDARFRTSYEVPEEANADPQTENASVSENRDGGFDPDSDEHDNDQAAGNDQHEDTASKA